MYASLLISMLAAFVAMLGKQWLNRYLRNSGGSMIERCGDRQRKCNGLEKWPLHFFIESLPVMLQVALLLLACGLCKHMMSVNTPVARTLISLTSLGAIFYIAIVITGTSSYACPFQTPVSIGLRGLWKRVRSGMWKRRVRPLPRRQSLPAILLENVEVQQSESVPSPDDPPQPQSLSTLHNIPQFEPWLKQEDLAIIRKTNTDDILCVSWILKHITDPEALDAALPLAGEIRWFDDGVHINPPFNLIVSTFEACFDPTRRLYSGARDRAYHSARAILWIHTLAMCKSEELARNFPLPNVEYTTSVPDPDLGHLLRANNGGWGPGRRIGSLLTIDPGQTPSHSQWISNLLLQFSSADLAKPHHESILRWFSRGHDTKTTISLNTTLNRILVWCTFLGSPIKEEALNIQDKSYDISYFYSQSCSLLFTSNHAELILDQLSEVVLPAINSTSTQRQLVLAILNDLVKLKTTPERLTKITYAWCSLIYENRERVHDWETILLFCLEIGFRHLDFQHHSIKATITHTKHHQGLVEVAFKSQKSEVIADLLHAWTTKSDSHEPAVELLNPCAGRLIDLHDLVPLSSRLRRLVIRSVELTRDTILEAVGVEKFIEFLNHLHVTTADMDDMSSWAKLLSGAIQSSEEPQHLSHWYWELLVELAVVTHSVVINPMDGLKTTKYLIKVKEWSKLERWMGIVWMLLPKDADPTEEDFGHSMTLLFCERPGAAQKLEQWMDRWDQEPYHTIPESFQRIHGEAREAAQRNKP